MLFVESMLLVAALLFAGLLLKPITNRLLLPFEALLVAMGLVAGLLIAQATDLGLHPDVYRDLVFYVFLPVLIFEAAYAISAPHLRRNLGGVLVLALPLVLISISLAALLIYYGIGHSTGFPYIAALLTGTMLAAIDTRALRFLLEKIIRVKGLKTLINGETLFNNVTCIALFSVFLLFAINPETKLDLQQVSLFFAWNVLGGAAVGLAAGFLSLIIMRLWAMQPIETALFTLLMVYLTFSVAEAGLQVSGVMAVLITGLIMGRTMHLDLDEPRDHFVDQFWLFNSSLAEALLYLILGLTISFSVFTDRWLAIVIAIGAVVVARGVGVWVVMPILHHLNRSLVTLPTRRLLFLCGSRGTVTIALALAIPSELDYWWTIQSIGFGVVLFSLFVQIPMLRGWSTLQREQPSETEKSAE